jgi:gamma-glutamyltranspeptidase/glutathione hydrolase
MRLPLPQAGIFARLAVAGLLLAAAVPLPAGAVSPPPVEAHHGLVVTTQHLASEVGVEILKAGGNAVDAAVAVGYALAVTDPCCGNIGGGGFMTIHLADGRDVFVNFREKAPLKATRDMYLDASRNIVPGRSTRGYLAVGVPGTVLGLDTALAKYGTMKRAQVMAPAIKLADEGFTLEPGDVVLLDRGAKIFAQEPNVAAIFLKDGKPYAAGDRLVQKNLAATLELIAQNGPDAFYKGAVADEIVAASAAHGGILEKKDFADYRVEETAPVTCDYRGYHVISAPPPSSGGVTMCLILNILEPYPMGFLGFHSAQGVHYMVEAMRHAYVDRNAQLGDPDFVKMPLKQLLSKGYADKLRAEIEPYRATPSSAVAAGQPPHEGVNTTHYSIVDAKGNAVSVTYTINSFFGAKVIAGNTGFFLNDEMDDFTAKPGVPNQFGLVQGERNAIQPGKRPLSSMTPSIVMRDGKLFMVLGSPGGSRIITITLETLMNVVDYGMDVQAAVDAPRIHHQWLPDVIQTEPGALSADTVERLQAMGYRFKTFDPWGAAEAILVDPRTGALYGANDDRHPAGAAIGY